MIVSRTFSAILSEATASASFPCPPLAERGRRCGEPLPPRPAPPTPPPAAVRPRCASARLTRLTRCSASSEVLLPRRAWGKDELPCSLPGTPGTALFALSLCVSLEDARL